MAQYAILIYAPTTSEADDQTSEQRAAHDRDAEQLISSGAMVAAFVLEPADTTATSIRGDVVTDGPFVDAKEVIAGFCVIEAADLDAALEIAGATRPPSRAVGSRCDRSRAASSPTGPPRDDRPANRSTDRPEHRRVGGGSGAPSRLDSRPVRHGARRA